MRLFFFLLSVLGSMAQANAERLQLIDFHFHTEPRFDHTHIDKFTNHPDNFFHRRTTVLIDQAYAMGIVHSNIDRSLKEIDVHRRLSDSIGKAGKAKAYGLCGVDLSSPDPQSQVRECLRLPHMVGVKLHLHDSQTLLHACQACLGRDKGYKAQLAEIAEEVSRVNGIILIHFVHFTRLISPREQAQRPDSSLGLGVPQEEAEASALLDIAGRFPKTRFIIAHGGVNSSLNPIELHKIAEYFRKNPGAARNIYVESSIIAGHAHKTALCFVYGLRPQYVSAHEDLVPMTDRNECADKIAPYAASDDSRTVIDSWRALGMDRVLFGSDAPGPSATLESIQYILTNPFLTEEEKQRIFLKNGEELLAGIRK